jgi:hypothetical protein
MNLRRRKWAPEDGGPLPRAKMCQHVFPNMCVNIRISCGLLWRGRGSDTGNDTGRSTTKSLSEDGEGILDTVRDSEGLTCVRGTDLHCVVAKCLGVKERHEGLRRWLSNRMLHRVVWLHFYRRFRSAAASITNPIHRPEIYNQVRKSGNIPDYQRRTHFESPLVDNGDGNLKRFSQSIVTICLQIEQDHTLSNPHFSPQQLWSFFNRISP